MDVVGNAYRMYQIASHQLITKRSQLPLFPSLFDTFVKVKVSRHLSFFGHVQVIHFLISYFLFSNNRTWHFKQQ
jgi:hypothetical protein